MKKLIIGGLIMFFSVVCYGQEKLLGILPLVEKEVTYTNVVTVDSVKATELYIRAKLWLADAYKSSKDVIQVEDKEAGQIVGKGIASVNWQSTFMSISETKVYHTITIQVKDGRYRYEISSFLVKYDYKSGNTIQHAESTLIQWSKNREENSKKYFANVDEVFKKLIASLEKAMNKPSKSSNW